MSTVITTLGQLKIGKVTHGGSVRNLKLANRRMDSQHYSSRHGKDFTIVRRGQDSRRTIREGWGGVGSERVSPGL